MKQKAERLRTNLLTERLKLETDKFIEFSWVVSANLGLGELRYPCVPFSRFMKSVDR